jgi:hypothetical protein
MDDQYGKSVIRNIYFDTPSYLLIRNSIDKPIYKEKIRLRSYAKADPDTPVFLELKKKFKGVVYKRRVRLKEKDAIRYIDGKSSLPDNQISREIDYFISFYKELSPKMVISYERDAFYSKTDETFRITFDRNVLYRCEDLSLSSDAYGKRILDEGYVLMEVKTAYALPLWFSTFLSENKIYKTSFSKYGTAYQTQIYPEIIAKKTEEIKNERVIEQHLRKPADSGKHKYGGIRRFIRSSFSSGRNNSSGVYV